MKVGQGMARVLHICHGRWIAVRTVFATRASFAGADVDIPPDRYGERGRRSNPFIFPSILSRLLQCTSATHRRRHVLLSFLAAICVSSASAQHVAFGTLNGLPQFDFNYLPALSRPADSLQQGQVLQLQARFVWDGNTNAQISTEQHTVVAFTHRGATNSLQNNVGDVLWTHGAGATLGERGLGLELWHRSDTEGDGYDDDRANAVIWTQYNNRCAEDVLGTIPPGIMCLPATPNGSAFITQAPEFTLRTGVAYWVRVSITPTESKWATLYADLVEEMSPSVPVQSAAVNFPTDMFFPMAGQEFSAAVARASITFHQPTVQYAAFDYGF